MLIKSDFRQIKLEKRDIYPSELPNFKCCYLNKPRAITIF